MFGEGTDRENNKKNHISQSSEAPRLITEDNMNSARQSIHRSPDSMVEDTRTALGNQFIGLRTRFEGEG